MEINNELLKDLMVEMVSKMSYEDVCELLEMCDEEVITREEKAFEEYVRDCENRGFEQDELCPGCPAFLECKSIREYEEITGESYDDLLEEAEMGKEECDEELKTFITDIMSGLKPDEKIVLRIKFPSELLWD